MAQPPVDPVQKSTFLIARLGHRLLLRLTSTASRGGRDFSSSMRKTLIALTFRQDLVFAQRHSIDSKESAEWFLRRSHSCLQQVSERCNEEVKVTPVQRTECRCLKYSTSRSRAR